jgi:hypothetical protein
VCLNLVAGLGKHFSDARKPRSTLTTRTIQTDSNSTRLALNTLQAVSRVRFYGLRRR